MSIFGDLERLLADLYPYRIPLTLGAIAVIVAAGVFIVRRGWHRPTVRWTNANRLPAAAAAVLLLAVALPAGYYLLSPLWERTTLIEASPLDAAALATPAEATATPASGTAEVTATAEATTTEAAPTATEAAGPQSISHGEFEGADSFHFAEGQALIIQTAPGEYILRFENFSIRNGPDLFVYLSSDPDQPSDDAIRLGGLKATDGAFNYEIPSGLDVAALTHAMVWCDQFAVLFANASLR